MEMEPPENSLTDITRGSFTETVGRQNCSAGLEKNLSCAHGRPTRCSHGGGLSTQAGNEELTAQSSETKADTVRVSLSDRLTPLLISAGLVAGIIPMSMREGSGQLTLDTVLRLQAGHAAEQQKAGS